jgi:cbb3-type cytochrome oxidase maturation protein
MSVVFILVFVAIIMAVAFLIAFIWAVKSGQYEDTYTPSVRILFDDAEIKEVENSKEIQKKTGKGKKEKTEAVPL